MKLYYYMVINLGIKIEVLFYTYNSNFRLMLMTSTGITWPYVFLHVCSSRNPLFGKQGFKGNMTHNAVHNTDDYLPHSHSDGRFERVQYLFPVLVKEYEHLVSCGHKYNIILTD